MQIMKTVILLHGEVSEDANRDEQDVLVQVDTVSRALTDLGFTPIAVPVSLNITHTIDTLHKIRPVFVFNLVESISGQGSLIHIAPAIMDSLKIPYTGAGTEATFLTSHKVLAKEFLLARGIATPHFLLPGTRQSDSFSAGTYIIKSIWEHASSWLGDESIVFSEDPLHLSHTIAHRQEQLGIACYAEAFIEGREFNLSLLAGHCGPEVLPPAEIIFDDYPPGKYRVVDFRAKWVEDSFEYRHTPRRFDFPAEDEPLIEHLSEIALQCWHIFSLRGYARVDFRVDTSGKPWVLEVNTNPCLSPDGGFYAAVEQSGLSFHRAIERIIHDARKQMNGTTVPQ